MPPQGVLELGGCSSAERLGDGAAEELVAGFQDWLLDAAVVAPAGQRLRGRRQLLIHGRAPFAAVGVGAAARVRAGRAG